MKILLISFFFPPFNSVGAIRTNKTAKTLADAGHDIRVISCANQSLPSSLPLEISENNVEYTRWWNVNSPVEFLLGGKNKVAAKGFVPSANHLPDLVINMGAIYRNLLNFPDGQVGWYPFAKRAGDRIIQRWVPDLIFASAAPYTSLLVASALSRKYNIPWVAEFRDLWVDNHQRTRPLWRNYFERKLERFVLRSACGLVTVSRPLAEILESKYKQPCEVITNGFDPHDYPDSPKTPFSNGTIHIVHTGQLFGIWRNPSPLFSALALMGNEAEKIRVHFYGRHIGLALNIAESYGVSHLIEIHKQVSYIEALKIQSEADVLLLIPGQGQGIQGVYTTKLFEYLGARRPILCIGASEGVAAELIRERDAGVALDHPEEIVQQLKQWIQQKNDNKELPYLPAQVGKGFTRKEQTEKLVKFLQTCLNNSVSA
jgi:hypothetical protein